MNKTPSAHCVRHSHRTNLVMIMHYVKIILRGLIFIGALVAYIVSRVKGLDKPFGGLEDNLFVTIPLWIFFVANMIPRFFPSKTESTGALKHFKKNYIPREYDGDEPILGSPWRTFVCFAAWVALNLPFGILHLTGVLDEGIMVLLFLFYSVCDIICVLFFCPFQSWFLKNRCCTTCRIYNWDFPMMFTPLVFMPGLFNYSLVAISLVLLILWEVTIRRHPERFSEKCNDGISCSHCNEKLCHHKVQLRAYLKKEGARLFAWRHKKK